MDPNELIAVAESVAGEFTTPGGEVEAASVAAAILSGTGNVYTGICIDARCSLGFCAEHAAIAEMLKARESVVVMVVAVDTSGHVLSPCGRCRELLWQLDPENRETTVVLAPDRTALLRDLLPFR